MDHYLTTSYTDEEPLQPTANYSYKRHQHDEIEGQHLIYSKLLYVQVAVSFVNDKEVCSLPVKERAVDGTSRGESESRGSRVSHESVTSQSVTQFSQSRAEFKAEFR